MTVIVPGWLIKEDGRKNSEMPISAGIVHGIL